MKPVLTCVLAEEPWVLFMTCFHTYMLFFILIAFILQELAGNDREGRTRLGNVLGQIQNGFPTRTAALQMVGPKHHHLRQCSDIQAFYTFNSIIQLRSHS